MSYRYVGIDYGRGQGIGWTPVPHLRGARLPHGRQVMCTTDGLGFSLKPPKWLRKAQPGKILGKIALPAAAIGAALLLPGVGGILASSAIAAAGSRSAPGIPTISPIPTLANPPPPSPSLSPPSITGGSPSIPTPIPLAPSPGPTPTIPASNGSSALNPVGTANEMPGWLIPAGLGVLAFMFLRRR